MRNFLQSEKVINTVIALNGLVLLLDEFPTVRNATGGYLHHIDSACVVFYLLEAISKIQENGKAYFKKGWNRFDFGVLIISLPALLAYLIPGAIGGMQALSAIRAGRLLRMLRLLKFIPNLDHLMLGIQRALKASVGIFLALGLINIILALGATVMFGEMSPEHFGNPARSSYSLLKIFTVEGWYEIPDSIGDGHPLGAALRTYVILTMLIAGILGMGLANAVFIDEMTADNNADLEQKIDLLQASVDNLAAQLNKEDGT